MNPIVIHRPEPLEVRIAPAAVSVTFNDIDGDSVKITASAGPLALADLAFVGGGVGGQLATLNLTHPGFAGAKISFTVKKKAGGDGLVHVGYINATGNDLVSVALKGDLGRIDAGDNDSDVAGLGSLSVGSLGFYGLATQGSTGNLVSTIAGNLDTLKVARDVVDAHVEVTGSIKTVTVGRNIVGGAIAGSGAIEAVQDIGSVTVGGDIVGGAGEESGGIITSEEGDISKIKVAGNIIGGAGESSGGIAADGDIFNVTIGKDVIGGAGSLSGGIVAFGDVGTVKIAGNIIGGSGPTSGGVGSAFGDITSVTVGKSLRGGTGSDSGGIATFGGIGTVKIGGSIIGGGGSASGTVFADDGLTSVSVGGNIEGGTGNDSGGVNVAEGALGTATIKGSVIGGSISGAASLQNSGRVAASGGITSLTIGGSVIAGVDASTGTLSNSGAIVTNRDIGTLTIKGSILGNATHSVVIAAVGQAQDPVSGDDIAIATLNVGRDVVYAQILGGYGFGGTAVNADASIGKISVGGNWRASSVAAGVQDAGDPGYGSGDILQTTNDNVALISRIASITIKGVVAGTAAAADNFGFVAQQIDFVKIGGRTAMLTTGPSNNNILLPFTDDVHILEV